MKSWRIDCVVGARPNFVKIAPIMRAFRAHGMAAARLIHTGQHYDIAMNEVFFRELDIPDPDINLEVGSGTNTEQTAKIMLGLEPVMQTGRPDMVLVVGDVNSTVAASLVAAKLLIPVTHVEAGLRSNDRTMPEEINRLVTDRLSDLLLTTDRDAASKLVHEGAQPDQIHFVGNVMIDTLYACLNKARDPMDTLAAHGASEDFVIAAKRQFGLVTLHRPSNVDNPGQLKRLLQALADISKGLPLVFAMHPRTRTRVTSENLEQIIKDSRILLTPPLSYLQNLGLMRAARLCITDSGGIQEETTALGVACLTVRNNTERPITITEGSNTLIGSDADKLRAAVFAELGGQGNRRWRVPELWDGRAAERVTEHVIDFLSRRATAA